MARLPKRLKPPTEKASDRVDRELATAAIRKRQAGETPSAREVAALRRYERGREEQQRWEFYRSIPQKHWREMSGRQTKILQDQARRYGIPFDSRTIDLPEVVKRLHDFFAKNAKKLSDDEDLLRGDSPNVERIRAARAEIVEMERDERRGTHLPMSEMAGVLSKYASAIRSSVDQVRRLYGNEPADIVNEHLEELLVSLKNDLVDIRSNVSRERAIDRSNTVTTTTIDATVRRG